MLHLGRLHPPSMPSNRLSTASSMPKEVSCSAMLKDSTGQTAAGRSTHALPNSVPASTTAQLHHSLAPHLRAQPHRSLAPAHTRQGYQSLAPHCSPRALQPLVPRCSGGHQLSLAPHQRSAPHRLSISPPVHQRSPAAYHNSRRPHVQATPLAQLHHSLPARHTGRSQRTHAQCVPSSRVVPWVEPPSPYQTVWDDVRQRRKVQQESAGYTSGPGFTPRGQDPPTLLSDEPASGPGFAQGGQDPPSPLSVEPASPLSSASHRRTRNTELVVRALKWALKAKSIGSVGGTIEPLGSGLLVVVRALKWALKAKSIGSVGGTIEPLGSGLLVVVRALKWALKAKSIGSVGGTIEPLGSGLLVVSIGQATRFTSIFQDLQKELTGTIRLGLSTETFDSTGKVTESMPWKHITDDEIQAAAARFKDDEIQAAAARFKDDDIQAAAARFKGEVMQVPPLYATATIKGRAVYKLNKPKGIHGMCVSLF
eukprot:gene15690-21798_t